MSKKITITLAICSITLLAACNTVKGVGRDIGSAGSAIEKTVD